MCLEKITINPLLSKKIWDFADMAVAQDWELERGNEGALIWTDLGPNLARLVCEDPGTLSMLARFIAELRDRAEVHTGLWSGMGTRVRAGVSVGSWSGSCYGARARAEMWPWDRVFGIGAKDRARIRVGWVGKERTRVHVGIRVFEL